MRFLSTRAHGMLDWLMGPILIIAPLALGLDTGSAEGLVPMILGVAMILLAFFTNYELGVVRNIPVPTHLTIDLMSGAFLAVSPWLFGFNDRVWLPHLLLGLVEIGSSLMTRRNPAPSRSRTAASRA